MAWAPDYVTTDELSTYLRIDDAVDEVELGVAIAAASRAIDHATNRQFGKVEMAEERTYRARPDYGSGYWVVDVDDYQTAAGLAVDVGGTAVAAFVSEPVNAAAEGRPWTRVAFTGDSEAQPATAPHEVAVTAVWGWTAVPVPVAQATLLQASRFVTRRNAPFGIAGSPDSGSEMRLLARLDPDVAVALRPFARLRSVG